MIPAGARQFFDPFGTVACGTLCQVGKLNVLALPGEYLFDLNGIAFRQYVTLQAETEPLPVLSLQCTV
jgi:hypothetical protein